MISHYQIWCRVSGGVTGTREAWLKERGKVMMFTEAEAIEHAALLNKEMNNRFATANFEYSVRRV